jgi:hypothetical protein
MKKSIFILLALFAATFANAQITLEHTFEGQLWATTRYHSDVYGDNSDAPYFYSFDNQQLKLYDKNTYELYKTYSYTIPSVQYPIVNIWYVTKNIFTTDGKTAFIFCFDQEDGDTQDYCKIIDEDGNVVFDFNNSKLDSYFFTLVKINGQYKLLARERGAGAKTYIYSLPGNGEEQAVSTPSSLKRSARKIAHEGQVLVETDTNTFDLRGQKVK